MRKIIFSRSDGGLSVVHPVRNSYPNPETLSDDEIEKRAWAKLPADAIDPQWVEEADIPTDRTFRDAWAHGGTSVNVDMTKAREIQRDHLRSIRAPMLAALDVAYQRADESSDVAMKAQIAKNKQALRDVTADPMIDAATTPEELKAVMPDVLKT